MFLAPTLIASLPSPSNGTLEIGPLNIHAYGLMIALGVVAGVWLMGRRFEEKGIGTRDDVNGMAVWAVIAGVIGSRLYHVATDWSKFSPGHLSDIPKIWQGGLGIPGGLLFGIPVGLLYLKRKGIPVGLAANCGAPGIALAQAIARWGNYWNQELYGRPTGLPWGLEIDDAHRTGPAAKYIGQDLVFQPTFLYESLANFALVGILLLIDKRFKVRGGHLMAMYIMGYGAIRFFVEGLRIDEAHHVGGFRWNQWVALAAIVGGGIYLLISNRRPEPVESTQVAVIDGVSSDDDGLDIVEALDDEALDDEALDDDAILEDAILEDVILEDVILEDAILNDAISGDDDIDVEDLDHAVDIEDIDSEVDQADEVDNP